MQFGLAEEQRQLEQSLERLLDERVGLETIRLAAEGAPEDRERIREELTQALVELGLTGLAVPVEHGGLGLGMLDVAVTAECLGRVVAPVPFVAPLVLAPIAIRLGGSPAQQATWSEGIVSGEIRFAAALSEHAGARAGAGVVATKGTLSGEALFALDVDGATHVLVRDNAGALHIAAMDAPGLEQVRLTTVDKTRDFALLRFDSVAAEALANADPSISTQTVHAGRIALAADTLGAARTMLERSVDYAKERRQFNRVIGSFQAVKHMCAEMAAELEPCQAMVWHAAHAYDEDPEEGPVLSCHVKAHLAEVGTRVARTATEVHGGMGFTDLLGLHYWFKRIGVNRQALGGPEQVREEAARLQGWVV